MIALLVSVFVASLLGSAHCAGMCGPLVVCSGAPRDSTKAARLRTTIAYQLGRLVIYCVIGALAGLAGSGISHGGTLFGLQRASVWLAGGMLVGVGLMELGRVSGVWTPRLYMPNRIVMALAAAHRHSMRFSRTTRAATIGLLSGLMPCGWLYAFALSATATARIDLAILVMAVFWAGSVPMLVLIAWGSSAFFTKLMHRVPYATGVALIAAGLLTLNFRHDSSWMNRAAANDWAHSSENRRHVVDSQMNNSTAGSLAPLADHIDSLDHTKMPCCADDNTQ